MSGERDSAQTTDMTESGGRQGRRGEEKEEEVGCETIDILYGYIENVYGETMEFLRAGKDRKRAACNHKDSNMQIGLL